MVGEQVWSIGGMLVTGENWSTWIRNQSQCHSVYQEFHMDWNGTAFWYSYVHVCNRWQSVTVIWKRPGSFTGRFISLFGWLRWQVRCSWTFWLIKENCLVIQQCTVWLRFEFSGSGFKARVKNSCHRFAVPLLPDNLQGSCLTHWGTLTLHQRLIPSPTALYPGKIPSTWTLSCGSIMSTLQG